MTRKEDEIKNQLIVCSREGRWKFKISPTLKTNPLAGINCPSRIYVYILKDVSLWTISKKLERFPHKVRLQRQQVALRAIRRSPYMDSSLRESPLLGRMRSTQRSKSMHAFFNKFSTRNSSLSQFVKQYDNCLAIREQREREFDATDFHIMILCATKPPIEA
ncbi:hypothetical protein Ahy_A07g032390 [Arachis hypogaea]|uniref:Protein FAR1-RELATED SEQUENCE n=1 Tax=Arachis hypogaea TaxID=3818 RepID=A0A445C6S3_ARAHY|nr:hypothetical protein Ahy_A07g032390 [Arachis hypogaea]